MAVAKVVHFCCTRLEILRLVFGSSAARGFNDCRRTIQCTAAFVGITSLFAELGGGACHAFVVVASARVRIETEVVDGTVALPVGRETTPRIGAVKYLLLVLLVLLVLRARSQQPSSCRQLLN
jgi:hypothetical protein